MRLRRSSRSCTLSPSFGDRMDRSRYRHNGPMNDRVDRLPFEATPSEEVSIPWGTIDRYLGREETALAPIGDRVDRLRQSQG